MKTYITSALNILSLAALVTANCHGNNCARAVTGTGAHVTPALESRKSDCSSFMLTTVTPAVFTTTKTTTIYTSYKDKGPKPSPRPQNPQVPPAGPVTVIPTSVPSYVTKSCTSEGEYSSVCSCWNIPAAVTTVATPTVPVTAIVWANVGCDSASHCRQNGFNTFKCGKDDKERCVCLKSVPKGQQLCVRDLGCEDRKECRRSSDCDAGEGCVERHCCDEDKQPLTPPKTKICVPYAPKGCLIRTGTGATLEEREEKLTPRGKKGLSSGEDVNN
ncbi:hypothetical protein CkaCkLH20_09017 [Colletotrichum karsti]|uniref:Secreted protein n=1 Tax=Colletotrichum karsti TaxID=1095194 RepID=A0A9P6HZ61_9PEZI|nr:uncharacterized protein CkaCkLH20_09017 [Colletotrichum karsti]KAF9873558.1 hypothetical protein CkaCkLH20_09017 [Colletotrichum karsti]